MTSAQVVKMSVTVNNSLSPIQEYSHSDNHIQSTHDIIAELN